MPAISLWGLVISLVVLALGLVYKVVEYSHALKLSEKETDRLRSRLENLEEAQRNEFLSISAETSVLNTDNNNFLSKSNENRNDTTNKKRCESANEAHKNSAHIKFVAGKKVSSKISSLSEALSIEAVLNCLNDKNKTPLQKSIFVEHNSGSRVTWCAKVENVKKMWEHEKDGDIIIVISPISSTQNLKNLATATFPNSEIHSLSQAKSGDMVLIEGTLSFSELAGNWTASLSDSKFIRFEENA